MPVKGQKKFLLLKVIVSSVWFVGLCCFVARLLSINSWLKHDKASPFSLKNKNTLNFMTSHAFSVTDANDFFLFVDDLIFD